MKTELYTCDKCGDEQTDQRDMFYLHLLQSRHSAINTKSQHFETVKVSLWCRKCREKAGYFPEGKHLDAKLQELGKKELTMEDLLKNYVIIEKTDKEK